MADYNIYIHTVGTGGGNSNPTVAWSQREGGGNFSPTSSNEGKISGTAGAYAMQAARIAALATNPDSAISGAYSNLTKAFPIVAAAFAIIKAVESVADTAIEWKTVESGDYQASTHWNNFKANLGVLFHPVTSIVQNFRTQADWRRQNQKAAQQRDLFGDSVINSYTGKGV